MSGLFGSAANGMQQEVYAGIQVSTSQLGQPIPYIAGRQRVPFNLLWYGNFKATGSTPGGKGASGGGSETYNYTTAFVALLGLGPITGTNRIWHDQKLWDLGSQSANLAAENLALSLGGATFTGAISGTTLTVSNIKGLIQIGASVTGAGVTAGTTISSGSGSSWVVNHSQTVAAESMRSSQLAWSGYPSGTPSGQQLVYDSMSYVACNLYNLGSSASMPNLTVEVEGGTGGWSDANSMFDADPSAVLTEYMTDPIKGAGFTGSITPLTGLTNSYQAYCFSLNLLVSPLEDTQRAATDFIKDLLQVTNSQCFLSVNRLNILPLADQAVSGTTPDGSSWSYTPNLTPLFTFGPDDYCPEAGEPPVKMTRRSLMETHNVVNLEYLDRSDYYNAATVNASIISGIGGIALTGERLMNALSFHMITNAQTALMAAQLILQSDLFERNSYEFRTFQNYAMLEPLDYIALNDANLGLVNQVCRIDEVEDDGDGNFTITCIELAGVSRTSPQYNWAASAGWAANTATAPGSVLAPAIFVMPPVPAAVGNGITLGIAVGANAAATYWLGCHCWISVDGGNTYVLAGLVPQGARYGTISANLANVADPDTTSTLAIALNNTTDQISTSTTHADADSLQTLILVGSGSGVEVMAFGTASLVSAGNYDLTYLRRGLYGSATQAHSSGAQFVRLDGNIFQIPLDPGYAGQTVYFKFTSFNTWQQAEQELSAVTAYSYTIPSALPISGASALIPAGSCAVSAGADSVYKSASGASATWDSDARSPIGLNQGAFFSYSPSTTTGALMAAGLSTNPTANLSYTSIDYCFYFNAGTISIYESGTLVASFGSYTGLDGCNHTYDGVTVRYFHNGTLVRAVRAVGLTLYPKIAIANPNNVIDNIEFGSSATVNQPTGSWINNYPWLIGTSGSQKNFIDYYDGTNEDSFVVLGGATSVPLGPYGQGEPIWKCNGLGSTKNGGWTNSGDLMGIDSTKSYRSCVWVQWNGTGSGTIDHGCDTAYTDNLAGTQNTNPLFQSFNPSGILTAGKWYLMVGFVQGSGYGTAGSGLGGVYDPATGTFVANSAGVLANTNNTEFKCIAAAPQQTQRAFCTGFNNGSADVYFAKPRWDEVNGNEPSITSLLNNIGTSLMEPNSATTVYSGTFNPGSQSWIPVSGLPPSQTGTILTQLACGPFTVGDSSWTMQVGVSMTPDYSSGTTPQEVYMSVVGNDSGGTARWGTSFRWSLDLNSTTPQDVLSLVANFSLASQVAYPGGTVYVTIFGASAASASISTSDGNISAEIIQR